jgi:hypothetical protein
MPRAKEDFPPLLQRGEHAYTVEALRSMCVDEFPLSKTRQEIMCGFERIHADLIRLKIPCDIVFDGSFLTKEIDPDDVDFTVVVTPEFYESCEPEQLKYLEWIRDDFSIKDTHLCDCSLCVEYLPSRPEYFDGIQNREFWVNLYAKSIIYQRVRGVAIIHVA